MQSAIASAAAAMCTPARSWFTILTFEPWPERSPSRWTLVAIASSTGRARSNAAGSPEAITVSSPAAAFAAPPDSGASTWRSPIARSRGGEAALVMQDAQQLGPYVEPVDLELRAEERPCDAEPHRPEANHPHPHRTLRFHVVLPVLAPKRVAGVHWRGAARGGGAAMSNCHHTSSHQRDHRGRSPSGPRAIERGAAGREGHREGAGMAAVEIRGVEKRFGSTPVIHGIDVDIADGEFVVLVGPSGCGKSTLLRMIAGLEEVSGGEIAIGGRVVNDVPPKERDIAMVFQNYALYPHMTVFDNMAFSLRLAKAGPQVIRQRVGRAAEILGLEDLLERFPRQLSGGQRQRVAMGRAIVRDPRVFLFDEPLSNLDAKLRVAMRSEIRELHQRLKTTSVYVTHDQIEAMTMADRIVVMH